MTGFIYTVQMADEDVRFDKEMAAVNLPLHHKVQKFSSDAGLPGWSQKKGRKTVLVWWWFVYLLYRATKLSTAWQWLAL